MAAAFNNNAFMGAPSAKKYVKDNITDDDINEFTSKHQNFCSLALIKPAPDHIGAPDVTNWKAKAADTTSHRTTFALIAKEFMTLSATKFPDMGKYMPAQERINLLKEELKNPGTTETSTGGKASWTFHVKSSYDYSLADSTEGGFSRSGDTLYSKKFEEEKVLDAIKKAQPGIQFPVLPSVTPLEDVYIHLVEAHVDDSGKHLGRDSTFANISKLVSTSIRKEIVASFVAACPKCAAKNKLNKPAIEKATSGRAAKHADKKRAREDNNAIAIDDEAATRPQKRTRQPKPKVDNLTPAVNSPPHQQPAMEPSQPSQPSPLAQEQHQEQQAEAWVIQLPEKSQADDYQIEQCQLSASELEQIMSWNPAKDPWLNNNGLFAEDHAGLQKHQDAMRDSQFEELVDEFYQN